VPQRESFSLRVVNSFHIFFSYLYNKLLSSYACNFNVCRYSTAGSTESARRDLEFEINAMSMLDNPFVMKFEGVGSIPGSGSGRA
jgi:hypothetical protein